jgi:ribA/ribD-fused uncharacterized protein
MDDSVILGNSSDSTSSFPNTADGKLDHLIKIVTIVRTEVKANGEELKTLSNKLDTKLNVVNSRLSDLEAETADLKLSLDQMSYTQCKLERKIQDLETVECKVRLQIVNVPENKSEDIKSVVLAILVDIGLDTVNGRTIVETYKMGPFVIGKMRPIMVKFHHPMDREQAWKNRQSLASPVHFRQQYPEDIQQWRRVLQAIVNYARNSDDFKENTYLRNDKIVVKGKTYSLDTLHNLPSALQTPVGCTTNGEHVYFYGIQSPFSNFYPSKLTVDYIQFKCVEQAYFYAKSLHYKNYTKGSQILAESNPGEIKKLGGSFGEKDWDSPGASDEIMENIVFQKFTQNRYLTSVLLSTGEKTLVEANPYDSYWGAGCSATHAIAKQNKWTGKNNLGVILMRVREKLRLMLSVNS